MRDEEKLVTGEIYMDSTGNRVRITRVDSERVNWIDVETGSSGSTDLVQFSRKFYREKLSGEAA